MRLRSYGELAYQKRGLGAGETADNSAEAIFGKIIGGIADVAKVVVPAAFPSAAGGAGSVDELLKRLTNGTAIQPQQPIHAAPGISTNQMFIGGGVLLLAVLLLTGRRR